MKAHSPPPHKAILELKFRLDELTHEGRAFAGEVGVE